MSVVTSCEQQLSAHFSLRELVRSATAERLHINNTPPADVVTNLQQLARCCEQIRSELGGVPIIISSGYRSAALNKAVGGAKHSAHLMGLACDFTAPDFGTPRAVCQKLASTQIPFDQLILEWRGTSNWVHVGIAAQDKTARRQILTINGSTIRTGLGAH